MDRHRCQVPRSSGRSEHLPSQAVLLACITQMSLDGRQAQAAWMDFRTVTNAHSVPRKLKRWVTLSSVATSLGRSRTCCSICCSLTRWYWVTGMTLPPGGFDRDHASPREKGSCLTHCCSWLLGVYGRRGTCGCSASAGRRPAWTMSSEIWWEKVRSGLGVLAARAIRYPCN